MISPRALARILDRTLVAALALLATATRKLLRASPAPHRKNWVAIKLVGMGDAVLMLPALAAVRSSGARLTIITTAACAGIFSAPGVADQVLVLGRKRARAALAAMFSALRNADGVLDFEQHIHLSALLAALAAPRAPRYGLRVGRWTRDVNFDHLAFPGPLPRPMKEIFDDLARAAGFVPAPGLLPLPVRPRDQHSAGIWLQQRGLQRGAYIVIAPGSGGTVPFRRLDAAQWAAVARRLPSGSRLILVGTAAEAALIAELQRLAGFPLDIQMNFNLGELASLLAGARLVLAIDSGPMHLAAAMGTPVVGIFGPDTPARYAPYQPFGRSVWLGLTCSPCNNCFVHREARCVNPDRYACIRGITPEAILEAAAAASV